jgi:2-oxo-4-hydroxy-4-carboxy--5-ureidoimidazoline (OHCU) decarboxylase
MLQFDDRAVAAVSGDQGLPPQSGEFANGVTHDEAEVLYAQQEPAAASLFGGLTTAAVWRSKLSWYAISKLDPFASVDEMHATMVAVVKYPPIPNQLALLQSHPHLAGKETQAVAMPLRP